MTIWLRMVSVACMVALAVLSLLPAEALARTPLGGRAEHVIAYLGTMSVTGLAFRQRPRLAVQCGLLIAYAAVLEALQLCAPGRTPAVADFLAGAAGVALGGAFLWLARDRVAGWLRLN